MNLVVFDIDGTLTRTMDVDTECFIAAVQERLDYDPTGLSWSDFPDVTDQGVLRVLYRKRWGREPTAAESQGFIDRFVQLLEDRVARDADQFSQVPGAGDVLDALLDAPGWDVAMATGGWDRTARLKLETAALYRPTVQTATSSDHHTREGIFRIAVERARAFADRSPYDRIVSIGDGAWDVSAARNLEVGFIGIGPTDRLERIGAPVGLEDYRDLDRVWALLETAPVP